MSVEFYPVEAEYQGIKIPNYTNTWSAFDKAVVDNKTYYIMENDVWGDETWYLVCTFENNEIQVICETYDNIEDALTDEGII